MIPASFRAAGCTVAVALAAASAHAQPYSLTILHNNDGESDLLDDPDDALGFSDVATFATLVDQTRSFYAGLGHGVLTVYAGDSILPGPEFSASLNTGPLGGRTYFDATALNAIGYDVAAVGNHEFDSGPEVFADFLGQVGFPYLSANLDTSGEAATFSGVTNLLPSTVIPVTAGGATRNVGVIGATTTNLPFITSTGGVTVDPLVAAVNSEIANLQGMGVDNIILVSHLQGIDEDLDLVSQLNAGVDLVIAGGGDELLADLGAPSPTAANAGAPVSVVDTGAGGVEVDQAAYPNLTATDLGGNAVPVVTGPGGYDFLGRVTLNFDAAGDLASIESSSNPQLNSGLAADAGVTSSVVDPVQAFVDGLAADILATTSAFLPGDGTRDVLRAEETPLGNLFADSFLDAAQAVAQDFGLEPDDSIDFAIANGGGIRTDVNPGDISVLTTFNLAPFGNILTLVEDVTAEDVKLIFENAYSQVADGDPGPGIDPDQDGSDTGRYLHVSEGVEIVYDITAQRLVLDDDGNVVTQGERIVSITINGLPVVVDGEVVTDATFDIAAQNFLVNGGNQIFNANYLSQDYSLDPSAAGLATLLGILDQAALQEFLEELAAGDPAFDLTSDLRYDLTPDGRIVPVPEPTTLALAGLAGLAVLARRRRSA